MDVRIFRLGLIGWLFLWSFIMQGQQQDFKVAYQFMAYDQIPTWKGVATNWETPKVAIHLFDIKKYKGHGNYVCYGLKTGLLFNQFKELVRDPAQRAYLPLFLYDLRTMPIYKNGQKYTWAVRLEDYNYKDDRLSMEQTFVRLMKAVEDYMEIQMPSAGKGVAILSSAGASLPNMTIRGGVEQQGYITMTQSQLIAATKGMDRKGQELSSSSSKNDLSANVLNEGVAVGFLKVIRQGEEDQVKGDFKNILLYQSTPHRVPIANGILTIDPQTPFSHINLLAKNRGTINAYLTSKLPSDFLTAYEGQLIKITAQRGAKKTPLVVTKISEKEAQKYWATQKQLTVSIPAPDLSVRSFSHFNTGAKSVQTIACIGAKASNYALLYHNFPEHTRPGFAIPFSFYANTVASCGAKELIHDLLKNKEIWSSIAIKNALRGIRSKISKATLEEHLFKELTIIGATYYKGKKIRLRSSTNCEDLPQFNGAGLYVSKGYWEGSERSLIQGKILEIYASLWLDRAFEEREFFGINHQKAAMGILINEAFPDEYANGVALTLPNATGTPTIHINTQYGELSVTNPTGAEVPEVIFFRQIDSPWYVTTSKSSVKNIFVDNPTLTPLVRQLQKACAQIDALWRTNIANPNNYGVDMEFKIMKEKTGFKLYIKQVRLLNVVLPE